MTGLNAETRPRHTIAVAVQPPILAELLGRALRAADYDVVVVAGGDSVTVVHYDLAVVSGQSAVDADIVIRIPDDVQSSGSARTSEGVEAVELREVESLVRAVRRYT